MLDQTSDLEIEILEVYLTNICVYKRTRLNKLDSYLSDLKDLKKLTIKSPIFLDLSGKHLIDRYNTYTNMDLKITFKTA